MNCKFRKQFDMSDPREGFVMCEVTGLICDPGNCKFMKEGKINEN